MHGILKVLFACQSKDQLKQLRAQKAAQQVALAESQRKANAAAAAAAAAAQLRPKGAAGMPPPAPRAPSGSMPAATSSSSAKPQAALIRPKPLQTGQRSVNGAIQEPARPSGMQNDLMHCDTCNNTARAPGNYCFVQSGLNTPVWHIGLHQECHHTLTVSQLCSLLV